MVLFPNCKINLGLHILARRPDGFHDLETLFYPVPLYDGLEVIEQADRDAPPVTFTSSGLTLDIAGGDNICTKAYQLVKERFPDLPRVKIHLHKNIPSGAGLGGGSADGASMLGLLNRKFNLGLNADELASLALRLGSDCPFFLINRPCHARGRGEHLDPLPLDLSAMKIVLVNPRIHVGTGWAFSQITPRADRPSLKDAAAMPVTKWQALLGNDFELPVFQTYPAIGDIKQKLLDKGALYAAMSGSGSTVFGLFAQETTVINDFPPSYFVRVLQLGRGNV